MGRPAEISFPVHVPSQLPALGRADGQNSDIVQPPHTCPETTTHHYQLNRTSLTTAYDCYFMSTMSATISS